MAADSTKRQQNIELQLNVSLLLVEFGDVRDNNKTDLHSTSESYFLSVPAS